MSFSSLSLTCVSARYAFSSSIGAAWLSSSIRHHSAPPHQIYSNSLSENLPGDAFEEGPFAHEPVGDMDASEHMGGDLELSKGGPLLESQPYLSVRSAPSHEGQESTRIGLSSNEFG